MTPSHELLTITGGVRVAVPSTPGLLTSYVLREQGDWFEDEIAFVRRLARPGMNVVDVGANYGVYALSLAQHVGPTGTVWAVEPARATAALLRESVTANAFENVRVIEAGLSNHEGSATLFTEANAEMNTLNKAMSGPRASATSEGRETVAIRTLDACAAEHAFPSIAFVKLDAEGEEERILEGGRGFFLANEPLCMFEWKHGQSVNTALLEAFQRLGMDVYRLQPGTCLLVPLEGPNSGDPFQLNLFAATPGRAAQCAADGTLVQRVPTPAELPPIDRRLTDAWLLRMPYAARCRAAWSDPSRAPTSPGSVHLATALDRYAESRDEARSPPTRAGALDAAMLELSAALDAGPRVTTLLTVARVAMEVGQRMLAIRALDEILRLLEAGERLSLDEPFLSPNPRFDEIDPGEDLERWCLAAIVEQLERLTHYSSFYTGAASLPRLRFFAELGLPGPEMARRLELVEARLARELSPQSSPSSSRAPTS